MRGLVDPVDYLLLAGDLQAGFGAGGVVYQLFGCDPAEEPTDAPTMCSSAVNPKLTNEEPCWPLRAYRVHLEFVGAQPVVSVGTVPSETAITYRVGSSEQHHHDVPAYL